MKRKPSSGRKKKPKDLALDIEKGEYCIYFKDVVGAKIKRERKATQKAGQGVCQGIALFVYEWKDANKLRDRIIMFKHPCEEVCVEWVQRIQNIVSGVFFFKFIYFYQYTDLWG